MNRFQEFAEYILHVPLNTKFMVTDVNGLLVNNKFYRVDAKYGLQTFENNQWNKVSGVYEYFLEGTVLARMVDKNNDIIKYSKKDILSHPAKVALARENMKKRIYEKILANKSLNSTEMGNLVQKTPKTIYHWEQDGIVPIAPKNKIGKRQYKINDIYVFLECVISHEWSQKDYIDIEELQSIYDYLKAKKQAKTKKQTRNKNANPYEYKGDLQ